MSRRTKRCSGAHRRKRRRRWSGRPQGSAGGPVRSARVVPLDSCRDDLQCCWHGTCISCGDTIHLATDEISEGFGIPDVEGFARLICGTPPRCADCREAVPT